MKTYYTKYLRSLCIVISAMLMSFSPTNADAQITKYLKGGNELSSNMVNFIMEDSEGVMWICTDGGLNLIDGAKSKALSEEENNAIRYEHVYEDSKGRKWICGSGRVSIYDKNSGKLKNIVCENTQGKAMVPSAKGTIEDKNGNVYIYTQGNGLFSLEETKGDMKFKQLVKKFPWIYIYAMEQDKNGLFWIATDKGLIRWDGKNATNVTENLTLRRMYCLCVDTNGNVWCGSDLGGLYCYNTHTKKGFSIAGLENTPIISLISKRSDGLLAGSNGDGLFEIKFKDNIVRNFNLPSTNLDAKKVNVHALFNDRNGNLWVGCYQKGIIVLRHEDDVFGYIGSRSMTQNWIGDGCVMSMAFDNSGTLWTGTDGDGLYYIRNGVSQHIAPHTNNMPKTIVALKPDNRGRLWIGSWIEGLWVMDIATQKMTPVQIPSRDKTPASVFSMTEDGAGRMWVATMGNGVFSVDMNTLDVKAAPMEVNDGVNYSKRNIIPNRWVNSICMGDNGILYIGTFNGLGAINTKTGNCLSTFGGKNQLLPDQTVVSLCYDKGMLWVGTGKGLIRLNTKDNSIEQIGENGEIAGNSIQSIIKDAWGNIWICTNTGISSIDVKKGNIHNYFSGKGMYANEFSKNAITKNVNGMIYMGGTEGITFFAPSTLSAQHPKPMLRISALYINGKAVTPDTKIDGYSIMETDISHAESIKMPYDNRDFMLELSAVDFMEAESINFEYRIDEGEWTALPATNNSISFSSLSVGKHKIEVRSREWDTYSDVKELTVIIRAPWYASWWAWLLYLLIGAALVLSFIRYNREKRKADKAEMVMKQQEELSEARLQSFMNISHEIRTPMSLIISPLQRLMANDTDPKHQASYQLMNRNAQRIQQLVNQLLDVRKIDKGQMKLYFRQVEMVSYVKNLIDNMMELCEVKRIKLLFDCKEEELKAWIDPMNFDKIIYNLLSNAIKHSPEKSTITVSLATKEDNKYEIIVSDEGSGIPEDILSHVFDRFFQQHNATNNTVQGSGIGLNLTRSLTNMHHGEIAVANNIDAPGCHFTLTLPLGREHIKDDEIDNLEEEIVENATTEEVIVPAVAPEHEVAKRPKSSKRLLIVEDDDEICHYLKDELKNDFLITICNNGEEAIKQIRKHMPDIIISDVMMPVMDGMTLLKQIRQNTTMNELPFIMLTAKTRDEDNIEGLQAGADAYITKPFNIEILRRTAINLVHRHDQLRNIYNGSQTPTVEKQVHVQSPDEKLMQRIMKVINDNISNPELGNDLITKEVGISRVHLYRKLKELTNLSLRDYIKNIRLTEAARLLSEQKHNISSIAQHTGFENVSYFTVVFKQKYGVSPSAYMESHSKKEGESKEEAKEETKD